MLGADTRRLFGFASNQIYLNHGGFGATPKVVLTEKKRILDEIEKNPTEFFTHRVKPSWHQTVDRIARRFALEPGRLAIVDNATDGVVAVLRSLCLEAGDEILTTSMSYGAIQIAARHLAHQHDAKLVSAEIRFPDATPEQCVEAVARMITPQTKIAVLDHITSATALVLPLKEMIAACHERGVAVLVDGAHAPGQLALDIPGLNADWYVGNLHKWYFVPRGCGFLWATPGKEERLMPNVLSWDVSQRFPSNFAWTGTRDPSNWLAVPAAFDFMDRFGESAVREHNQRLIRNVIAVLAPMWRFRVTTPVTMTAAITLLPTPDGLPYPGTDEGRTRLEIDLRDKHGIVVNPAFVHDSRIWLRITAQIYNAIQDYQKLGKAVLALC
ncbi:MAG TPA: aminotransferase class V-fold PLP-dependent enzyme [Candidatus Binataceae bacterium]|nr:aminotransferase class V-fold PLP-dependent enzyme [Candidatus Binataceae bacterium]